MPNQFFSPEGSLEEYFATDYWLFEQYIGDQLWLWGNNNDRQLGTNDGTQRLTPVQEFSSSTNWKQVSVGGENIGGNRKSAAIKTDGTLWVWGSNANAILGVNDNIDRSTPVQEFSSSTNWIQVSSAPDRTAAIKTDGTLWVWGGNTSGQLGVYDNIRRSTPVQEFTSSTNWKYVNCGFRHMGAIKTDGTLWMWGVNNYGVLGVNDTNDRSTPVQEFSSSTNWKQVACGESSTNNFFTAAIKTDGTLWTWGRAASGVLGINDTTSNRLTPVQEFTSSTNWRQLDCGDVHTAAIKTDGTLWSWGSNSNVQLGTNDNTQRNTPVQEFSSSTNWKQVACGERHTAAIKTDGTLWGWGYNANGQLGLNDTSNRNTPVQEFSSSTNWKQVSAAGSHVGAVRTGIEIDTGTLT